jgi:NADPH:quinone reductase-like Zn-dependent oxidoreductase
MFCLAPNSLANIIYIAASAIFGAKRVRFFSAAPMGNTMRDLTDLVDAGAMRPVVHSTYDLTDIASAHRSIEKGGGRGKRIIVHVHE